MANSFLNLEKKLNDEFNKVIHIYVKQRGNRFRDTIISGLSFETKEEAKLFLTTIKKKFGINGSIKMMYDIDEKNDVFVFTGDYSEKIKAYLIANHGKVEELITIHGTAD